jgi:DUF2971 family protein
MHMGKDTPQTFEQKIEPIKTELDESLKKVVEAYQELFDQAQGARPHTLFHYTNGTGLQGILESNRVWATHAQYLNDSTELIYACEVIKAAVEQQIDDQAPAAIIELGRQIVSLLDPLHIHDFLRTYMACFCEEGDLLSQWRGYGGGGGVGGYALGLEGRQIGDRFFGERTPEQDLELFRVIYDDSVQKTLINSVVSRTFDVLRSIEEKHGPDAAGAAMFVCTTFVQRQLAICLICFKSPAFSEEKEWRVVHVEPRDQPSGVAEVKFRTTATNIIPYIELDLSPQAGPFHNRIPLAKVVYGPSPHPDLLRSSLAMMLQRYGYRWPLTEIERSTIPLRA